MLLLLITPIIADVTIKEIFIPIGGTCNKDAYYIEGKDYNWTFDPVVPETNPVNCASACVHLKNCSGFEYRRGKYCAPWFNNACIDKDSPGYNDSEETITWSINAEILEEWKLQLDNMTSLEELMYGAKIGSVDKMQTALQNGAWLNSTDHKKNTALIWACRGGFLHAVTWLVANGSFVNNLNNYGRSALYYAAKFGLVEIGELLLKSGADLDIQEFEWGRTPLMEVIWSSNPAMDTPWSNEIDSYTNLLHQMLLSGADPDIQDNNGETALHYASYRNHYNKTKYLLDFNPRINLTNNKGSTALDLALKSGNEVVSDIFCSYLFQGCRACDSNVTACWVWAKPKGMSILWITCIVLLVGVCCISFIIFIYFFVYYRNIPSKELNCKGGTAGAVSGRSTVVLENEIVFVNETTMEISESFDLVDLHEDSDDGQQWQRDLKKYAGFQFKEELTIVKRNVGKGSCGVIHVAHGAEESTLLAVKEYHQKWTEMNWEAKEEFVEEIITSIDLQHRNVVRFYGFSKKPLVRIVMEYCEHGSCIDARDKGLMKELSDVTKIDILIGACRGLVYLCKKGIVHRDIAARNILLDTNFVPKIADFGRSRKIKNDCSHKTLTTVGPLKWMSPESIQAQISNFKSDVWSFGVTMWEIMEDKEPYHDMDPLTACFGVIRGDRLDVSKINTKYPNLAKLIMSCFSKDPELRPSMSDIYSSLENITRPQLQSEVSVVEKLRWINSLSSRALGASLSESIQKQPLRFKSVSSCNERSISHRTTASLCAPQSTMRECTPEDGEAVIYKNGSSISNTGF